MDFSREQIQTLQTVVGQVVDDKIGINNDILIQEMRALESWFDKKLDKQKDDILEAVGDMLGDSIVPQLDDHITRITKLEVKLV